MTLMEGPCGMSVKELSLTARAQAPARIKIKKPLHDFLFAAQAEPERPVPHTKKRATQRIKLGIGLECQKPIKFTLGELALLESLPRPLQVIYLPQVFKQVGKNNEPHGTFASLHVSFLHLSAFL